MNKIFFLTLFILISCKDDNWGGKVLDFAHNEAPSIVEELSRKDLEEKWFHYFVMSSSYGLEEVNKAHLMLTGFKVTDLSKIQNDQIELMKAAYLIDQQIEKTYEINNALFNAKASLQGMNSACKNADLLEFYTGNRIYLYNSFQMAIPLLNVSYGATVNFSYGSGGVQKNKNSEDSIPIIGNVFSYFSEKSYKKNLAKFKEAQDFITNIKLEPVRLKNDSNTICSKNLSLFKETNDLLRSNIEITQIELRSLYSGLMKLRDSLAPKVIQNIIAGFSSEDQLIYSIEANTKFTERAMQIYTTLQIIKPFDAKTPKDLIKLETQIDLLTRLNQEVRSMREKILAAKNQRLIDSLDTVISQKLNLLNSSFSKGVQP